MKRAQLSVHTKLHSHSMDYDVSEMGPAKPALKDKTLMHASNKKIFIGPAFQAVIEQELSPGAERDRYERCTPSHEILLWQPTTSVSPAKLNALVEELKTKGFDEDQVLAFLCYQLRKQPTPALAIDATLQALNGVYVGKQEGMPLHDKVLFVQGYGFHGKNFERIRDLVPNHSLQSLVNHYYTEFKRGKQVKAAGQRTETDVRKLTNAAALALVPDVSNFRLASEAAGGGHGSVQDLIATRMRILENADSDSRDVPRMAPVSKPGQIPNFNGLYALDAEAIAKDDPTGAAEALETSRIDACVKERVTVADSLAQAMEAKLSPDLSAEQENAISAARMETQKDPTPVWQQNEIMIFMKALTEFGTDFARSSLLLPSKTEQQVRNMYYNRAYAYGLDKLVKVHDDRVAKKAAGKT